MSRVTEPNSIRVLAAAAAILRPHQWIKNGFVGLGFLFGHE